MSLPASEHAALRQSTTALDREWRLDMEEFLYAEASLLDTWQLSEWLRLIDPACRYLVPALDKPDADYKDTLFLVSDDYASLSSRVGQLLGPSAWAENPRSRTRRVISNIVIATANEKTATVHANFAVWRFQHRMTDMYVGQYRHVIAKTADGFRFLERKAVLDQEALSPHGKLSFIL